MERVPYNEDEFVIENSTSKGKVSNFIRRDPLVTVSGSAWGWKGDNAGDVGGQDYDLPFRLEFGTDENRLNYTVSYTWEPMLTPHTTQVDGLGDPIPGFIGRKDLRDNANTYGGPYPVAMFYLGNIGTDPIRSTPNSGAWRYKRFIPGTGIFVTETDDDITWEFDTSLLPTIPSPYPKLLGGTGANLDTDLAGVVVNTGAGSGNPFDVLEAPHAADYKGYVVTRNDLPADAGGPTRFQPISNLVKSTLFGGLKFSDTLNFAFPSYMSRDGELDYSNLSAIPSATVSADTIAVRVNSSGGHYKVTLGNLIPSATVTLAMMANIATDSLIGRDTAGTGVPEVITVTGGLEFSGSGSIQTSAFTGDVTKTAGGTALTIANDAVTYAKMQNVSATNKILGRSSAGAGDVQEITCTSAARSILDDTSVGAIRTTLGVGTGDTPTFTGVTTTGTCTLGDAATDTHTINGIVTVNGTAASSGATFTPQWSFVMAATGDDPRIDFVGARRAYTNNTPAVCAAIAVPTDTTLWFDLKHILRRTNGTGEGACWFSRGAVTNKGGTLAINWESGGAPILIFRDNASYTLAAAASGANLEWTFTGVTGHNIAVHTVGNYGYVNA